MTAVSICRALTFLDPLFRGAAPVVGGDDALGLPRQVGDDEADARVSYPDAHSTFAATRRGVFQLCA